MKKGLLAAAAVGIAVVVFSFSAFASAKPDISGIKQPATEKAKVVTVSKSRDLGADSSKILEARFLNMLNHNFVYDETFDSVEDIINSSMPALLEHRDSEDDAFISQTYVEDYIFNMYGITDVDFAEINKEFDRKDGFVYILPRGFSNYSHSITSVTANEDGSYTVTTRLTENGHDSTAFTDTCTTLFVPNSQSAFGFNIIYSNIGGNAFTM